MCSISQLCLVFRYVISSSQGPVRTILKGKTRDETAKKHQQAKRAVGWTGEREKAQTPARPVSLTDFFLRLFPHSRAWS